MGNVAPDKISQDRPRNIQEHGSTRCRTNERHRMCDIPPFGRQRFANEKKSIITTLITSAMNVGRG